MHTILPPKRGWVLLKTITDGRLVKGSSRYWGSMLLVGKEGRL